MRTILVSAFALLLTTIAYAQSAKEQPEVPHAHYGRDGFWHCDPGYAAGESGGCEPVANPRLQSATGRLHEDEIDQRADGSVKTPAR